LPIDRRRGRFARPDLRCMRGSGKFLLSAGGIIILRRDTQNKTAPSARKSFWRAATQRTTRTRSCPKELTVVRRI